MLDTDVLVIGGGPAGTAAAITLARAGRDVTLVDKATFPRDKCCGDGLTTGALRILDGLGFDPGAVASWSTVDAAWVRSPSGREVRFPMPEGRGIYAAVAPRLQLDDALVQLARANGVKVHDGHGFESVSEQGDDVVTVEVEGIGAVRARYVIGADGMWSPLRRALGVAEPGYLGEWHAFRQYFSGVTGPAAERLYVWFEADLLPGYAWSFPLPGGRVNIGFGIERDHGPKVQEMKKIWPELLKRRHVVEALGPDATPEGRHLAWPIPARIDQAVLARGRTLFVGDAATSADPMTGEGIGQALLTGILAADAIVEAGLDRPEMARGRYRAAVEHHLFADHRMSVTLSKALRSERGARGAVRVAGLTPWTRRNFGRWLFEDEPRAIALTPKRWHRDFLGRAGAYVGSQG